MNLVLLLLASNSLISAEYAVGVPDGQEKISVLKAIPITNKKCGLSEADITFDLYEDAFADFIPSTKSVAESDKTKLSNKNNFEENPIENAAPQTNTPQLGATVSQDTDVYAENPVEDIAPQANALQFGATVSQDADVYAENSVENRAPQTDKAEPVAVVQGTEEVAAVEDEDIYTEIPVFISLEPESCQTAEFEGSIQNTPCFCNDLIQQPQPAPSYYSQGNNQNANTFSRQIRTSYPQKQVRDYLCCPQYECGFFAELLYLTSGMDQHVGRVGNQLSDHLYRELISFNDQYQPGFRIGTQYNIPNMGWDVVIDYLNFHNSKNLTLYAGGTNPPLLDQGNIYMGPSVGQNPGGVQTSTWSFNINQADVVLGNKLNLQRYYSLRPNIGVRSAYIHDAYNLTYFNTIDAGQENVTMTNTLQTFGFVFGLDNSFKLGYGLSIEGDAKIGVLFGTTRLSYYGRGTEVTNGFFGTNAVDNPLNIIPVVDGRIDLAWQHAFWGYGFTVSLGYEYHAWINGFINIDAPTSGAANLGSFILTKSNLYTHGLNCGVKMMF